MRTRWLLPLLWLGACATTAPEPVAPTGSSPTIVWPKAPLPPRVEYVGAFSSANDLGYHRTFSQKLKNVLAGVDDRRMDRPYAIAVDAERIAITDPGSATVHLFDRKRKSYRQLAKAGEDALRTPIGIALGNGRLYIADSALKRIFILGNGLKLQHTISQMRRPTGLAFDPAARRLYAADTLAHEIRVFDEQGSQLFTFGKRGDKDGEFNYPTHLTFANGRLYVNDTMNFRIQVFTPDGRFLTTLGRHGGGPGYLAQAKGLAVDSEGHLYVVDALENHVQIFDISGQFLLRFGDSGNDAGDFQLPAGMAIFNDIIYVADSYNHRVQIFKYLQGDN